MVSVFCIIYLQKPEGDERRENLLYIKRCIERGAGVRHCATDDVGSSQLPKQEWGSGGPNSGMKKALKKCHNKLRDKSD